MDAMSFKRILLTFAATLSLGQAEVAIAQDTQLSFDAYLQLLIARARAE